MTDGQIIDTAVFVAGLLIFSWCLAAILKKKTKSKPKYVPVNPDRGTIAVYANLKEECNVTTTAIYDNAEANDLLRAKMEVLEFAIAFHKSLPAGTATEKAVATTARIWWDFIALKPDDDSDE